MIRVVVFDDERHAVRMMEMQLTQIKDVQIVGQFTEYSDLVECVLKTKPDIAFLDIETPYKTGLEIAEEIYSTNSDTEIIFVTAHKKYAFDAFELQAQDYLLKPVKLDRLKTAIEKTMLLKMNREQIKQEDNHVKLHVKMMDKLEVRNQDNSIVSWRTKKTAELFAFLIFRREAVSSETIIENLWPDRELDKAKTLLYTTVYNLKKSIAPLSVLTSNNTYMIDRRSIEADYIGLYDLMQDIENSKIDSSNIKVFEEISEKYHGGFLGYNAYSWSLDFKIKMECMFLTLADKALDFYEDNDCDSCAIKLLNKLIKIDCYNENYYLMLLELYDELKSKSEYSLIKKKYKEMKKDLNNKK